MRRRMGWIALLASLAAACNGSKPAGEPGQPAAPSSVAQGDAPAVVNGGDSARGAEASPGPAWDEAGFRRVFSFVDNRHLIHATDTGLVVDFGHPSAYKYIQGRWHSPWQPGTEIDGRRVAYTDGIGATFRFPLTRSQLSDVPGDLELVLRMLAVGGDQRMDVFVNSDEALPTVTELPGEWGEVRVRLPADRLRVGENMIRFHFSRSVESPDHGRTAGGFDLARVEPLRTDPPPGHRLGAFALVDDAAGPALAAASYGSLATYLMVPEGARLRLRARAEAGDEPVPARVVLIGDGAEPVAVWEGQVGAQPVAAEVDLGAWVGQAVRLELVGDGPVTERRLLWIDPVLVVAEGTRRSLTAEERPRHALVWLIDALRADYVRLYNPDSPVETPNLTRLSDRCVAFRRASVQGNSSLPASGSIHTSTYPVVHRIVDSETRISQDLVVLGQAVAAAGWDTALLSSNGYVTQSRGFGRDVDYYRNLIHEPGRPDTEYLWPIASEWLSDRGDGSWFAFLNTIDPHVPYDPPEALLARYHPEPYSGRIRPRATGELLDGLGESGLTDADLGYLQALHFGEITYSDEWLGHALDELEQRPDFEDTLIVVLSDHGEAFMEHGRAGHGTSVNEEVIHIPLLLCHPRSLGDSRWVETEVESIDLYPTLLDLLGIDIPETVQGESLVPLMLDDTPVMNRPGFSYHQDFLRGLRIGRWKYQLRTGDNDSLYDLDEAAPEGPDRRDDFPVAHRFVRDVMAFHLAFDDTWRKATWGHPNNHSAELAERLDEAAW